MSDETTGTHIAATDAGQTSGTSGCRDVGAQVVRGVAFGANAARKGNGQAGLQAETHPGDRCEILGSDFAKLVVTFTYKNYRGEVSTRTVLPTASMMFMSNEWHPEPQWLLQGIDLDKGEPRTFAVKDISNWRPLC